MSATPVSRRSFLALALMTGLAAGCSRDPAPASPVPVPTGPVSGTPQVILITATPGPIPTLDMSVTRSVVSRFMLDNQAVEYAAHPDGCGLTAIRGQVRDQNGAGVAGVFVTVSLQSGGGADMRMTGADGTYDVTIVAGLTDMTFVVTLSDQAGQQLYADPVIVQAIPDCALNLMQVSFTAVP